MRAQGLSLDKYASKNVKVLVVANPANTNMLVLLKTVKNIPLGNFTCLTRLDEERLRNMVAVKINYDLNGCAYEGSEEGTERGRGRGRGSAAKVFAKDVKDVFIFGNHSTTQVSLNFNSNFIFKFNFNYKLSLNFVV